MTKFPRTKWAAFTAASLFVLSLSAKANHIDFLDAGPFSITGVSAPENMPFDVNNIPTASTLGGHRLVSIEKLTGPASGLSAFLNPVNPGANDDFMVFCNNPGSTGIFRLTVGAAAPLNANFLDIPGGGGAMWDRVRLTFDATQMSAMSPVVSVTLFSSTAGGSVTVTQTFAGGSGNVDFLLSAFTAANPAFNAAAFRDIDSASFSIEGIDGGKYYIASFDRNGFVPVPEPSTYALLAVGLVGAMIVTRRRRAGVTLA